MAPWRKKGANKKKADIGLVLGDLVLAKVKGYPYWPAKISRPEDWEQAPDQKKNFVQFFGTQEIAFVAPSDIQAFTNETKSKLCSRSQGKSKFFVQAVSEICAAFEEFDNKHPTTLGNDNEESAPCKALSGDRIDDDGAEVELKDGTGQGEPKRSNDIQLGETEREETKATASCPSYRASPTITSENITDAFHDAQGKEALLLSSRDNSSDVEGDVSADAIYDKVLQQADIRLRSVAANGNKSNRMASSFNRESEGGQKSSSAREASFKVNNPRVRSEALDSSEQLNDIRGIQKARDLQKVRKSFNVSLDPHKNIAGLKDMPSKKKKKAQSAGRINMLEKDEVLHPTKRSKWTERDAPPTKHSPKPGAATSLEPNNSFSHSNSNKIVVTQPTKRRRALRIDEDDDGPKTPVHGALGGSFKATPICETSGRPAGVKPFDPKESPLLFNNKAVSPGQQGVCVPGILCASITSKMLEPRYSSAMGVKPDVVCSEEKQVLVSSKKSPHLVTDTEPVPEQHKTNKPGGPKAALVLSSKSLEVISDAVNISQSEKNVQNLFAERPGTIAKAISRIGERGLTETSTGCHSSSEIVEVSGEDNVNSLINLKTSYSETSMKSLIATAQEKRRQAYSQHISPVNTSSFVFLTNIQGSSTSAFHVRPFLSSSSAHGEVHASQTNFSSLPTYDHQSSAQVEPDNKEAEERVVSPEYREARCSLSVGTEAAVTRDTFEGMIENLSRTKESIRRATRLAIDCAKHGIANEVVELLIQKLENESSFHRKVDIFFLVDSITQSSHNQKGIPGTSYVPIVQDALPRLLGAAVPSRPCTGAREIRHQCNKVLRLWIERKILPEAVLRRYIDDIGVSYDEPASGPLLKRTSRRGERAFDDPIREMEGMLVDEYGSNATYQFPGGFLSSQVFEDDDEDFPSIFKMKESDLSLDKRPYAVGESETCAVTLNHRHHSFCGKVNGELETEDVCGHLKNEEALFASGVYEGVPRHHGSDRIVESASRDSNDFSPLSEGSPPLPLDSPPLPPPLPPSPPLPPLPTQPHPLPSQLRFPPPPSLGGPPVMLQPVPAQPALLNQPSLPTESLPQSSQQLVYHPPLPHEFFAPGGNQIVQRSGSPSNGLFQQQPPCFVPSRISSAQDFSGFNSFRQLEHGSNGMYIRNPQQNQPFQPSPSPFVQAHFPPGLQQVPSNHFSYQRHVNQQQRPHPYPLLYSMQSLPEGHMQRVPADMNKMAISNEFAAHNSHGPWTNGMRNSTHSVPSCSHGGNFRPLPERQLANNTSFQHANLNNFPAAARRPGHAGTQIFPPRYVVNGQRAA